MKSDFFLDLEDQEKIGELKEIEQEELYINMLKEQRERVELFFWYKIDNFI